MVFALEDTPARFLQQRLVTGPRHFTGFGSADLIQGLVHLGDDREAVEDVQGWGALLAEHLQVGLPQVGANQLDLRREFFPHKGEEAVEGFDGALATDPEQTRQMRIDLVNQGQIFVTFGVWHLIHAHGTQGSQRAMLQAKSDHVCDGGANLFPGSMEGFGRLLPGKLACPTGQEKHIGLAQLVLAVAPRNLFPDHTAAAAVDAPHGIKKKHQKSPERDALKTPLGEMIVAGRRSPAARTEGCGALPRPDGDFDAFLVGTEAGMRVDESRKVVTVIENRGQLHGAERYDGKDLQDKTQHQT